MSWKVVEIYEAAYGCEERLPGEKTKVVVSLQSDDGMKKDLTVEDDWLYANGIDEGSIWPNEAGTWQPAD